MSYSYERYERRRQTNRSTFGFWVPLVVTVTAATIGLAAWVFKERRENDDSSSSDDADLSYGDDKDYSRPPPRPPRPGERTFDTQSQGVERRSIQEDEGIIARMSGAIRRTPSPQQVLDAASRKVAAGMAAAGAMAGGALSSIREESKDDFGDHSRWSEEATLRRNVEAQSEQSRSAVATNTDAFSASVRQAQPSNSKRKTVMVVISADMSLDMLHDQSYHTEQASILSHLHPIDFNSTNLLVLIYSPALASRPPPSLASSYSAISTPAQTPGDELASIDPRPHPDTPKSGMSARDSDTTIYRDVHAQAVRLVERPTCVMPFTTVTGFIPMVRQLNPDLVYVVESLSGENGANIDQIRKWVPQVIVVVGGDGAGLGGLIDTDDELSGKRESEHKTQKWWETGEMIGLGKGVEVVDGARFSDDFERRVGGKY